MASSIAAVDLALVVKDVPGDKLNDERGEIWWKRLNDALLISSISLHQIQYFYLFIPLKIFVTFLFELICTLLQIPTNFRITLICVTHLKVHLFKPFWHLQYGFISLYFEPQEQMMLLAFHTADPQFCYRAASLGIPPQCKHFFQVGPLLIGQS